jgi:hypothetical protein
MPTPKKKSHTARDMRAVSDNPQWTKAAFAKAKPFAEALPELAASIRKGARSQQSPHQEAGMNISLTSP